MLTESVDGQTDKDDCNTPLAFWPRGKNKWPDKEQGINMQTAHLYFLACVCDPA